jgi:hypothetical protein
MRIPLFAAALVASASLFAQQTSLKPYQESPAASVTQTLGISTVKIDYHRPAVKGRKVWGALVPFGEVWRTGANDATTITFSDAVKVGGKDLAAGTYSFFAIPGPEAWTLIFNKTAKQWGAYDYKAADDVLRIQAKPRYAPLTEYLTYGLDVAGPDHLKAELLWEHLAVGFDVTLDVPGLYWAHIEKTLAEAKPGEWLPYYQAATYCLNNNVHLDQAGLWANQSIEAKETPRNLFLKARLLKKAGKTKEAAPFLQKAIDLAAADKDAKDLLETMTKTQAEWGASR